MIRFYSTVKKLEVKSRVIRGWMEGSIEHPVTKTQTENLGWFVLLDGSHEFVHVGDTKPPGLEVGDRVCVTIAKSES